MRKECTISTSSLSLQKMRVEECACELVSSSLSLSLSLSLSVSSLRLLFGLDLFKMSCNFDSLADIVFGLNNGILVVRLGPRLDSCFHRDYSAESF